MHGKLRYLSRCGNMVKVNSGCIILMYIFVFVLLLSIRLPYKLTKLAPHRLEM